MATRLLASMLIALSLTTACGDDDEGDDDNDVTPRAGTGGSGTGGSGTGGSGTGGSGAGMGGAGMAGAGTGGAGMDGNGNGDGNGMNGERRITIVAVEFAFQPDAITASPGETLIITLQNDGNDDHNIEFELPDGEVELDADLPPGESAELTVEVPEDAGEFVFYCPIAGHRQLGMEGVLTVE